MTATLQPDQRIHQNFVDLADSIWRRDHHRPTGVALELHPICPGRVFVIYRCGICASRHLAVCHFGMPTYGVCRRTFTPQLILQPALEAAA